MRLSDIMRGISGVWPDMDIAGITCDSRRVQSGFAFVCLVGTAQDGHRFAADAVEKGAVAVITQRDIGIKEQWIIDDTKAAWPIMCANWFGHPADALKLIAFTGTNGKTSSTYLLKHILEQAGHTVGLIGTIQHIIGDTEMASGHTTPDAYELQELLAQMVAHGCDYVVMETSSHALDQGRVAGLHFAAGVFTNLTQDHLDYHQTMEAYLLAKKRLFAQCDCAILNRDDAAYEEMRRDLSIPVYTYSCGDDTADYIAHNLRPRADSVDFELLTGESIGRVRLPIPGMFSVYNAMGTAACAMTLGISFDTVITALTTAKGIKGRAEIVPTGRDFTVVIDYAHTPDGLENICKTMREGCKGRLMVLFGCGGDRDRGKRPQMGAIASKWADIAIVTSDNPRSEEPQAIIEDIVAGMTEGTAKRQVIVSRTEAIEWAITHAQTDDVILLAGKGHETYQILRDGTIRLDEREVVADVLKRNA